MIRRALWLGDAGAFCSLMVYGIARLEVPIPIVTILRRIAPAIVLWTVFRVLFTSRPKSRLVALLVLFWFTPILVWVLLQTWSINNSIEFLHFVAFVETAFFIILACTIPLVLGTPSYLGSAARLLVVAFVSHGIHLAFFSLIDAFSGFAQYSWYSFLTGLGWPLAKYSLFFAALAPDHMAMQRAARARKLLPICEKCEYDLTGNMSGVCPECGTGLSEALRQRLLRRGDDARAAEQSSAMGMDE